nr:hypothetical protein [Tanacetum cinerariifolium]
MSFTMSPHSPEYVPRDHVPVFVPEFEHPEDLVLAKDEAPASLLPPGFLSPRNRPLSPIALGAEMNAIASSLYHSLHPSGTPPLLPIPLSTPSTSRRARIPEAGTPPQNRPLLATPRPGCEVEESSATPARRAGHTIAHGVDCSYVETRFQDTERRMMAALALVNLRDRAAVKAESKVLRSERLAYEQKGIQTREALARSEDYCMALEARVAVLGTHTRYLEWQRQAADDLVAPHSSEYVPRDHVPVFVPEFEHPEDLVPAKDEAHASLLPPGFLSPRNRPLSPRALGAEMNAIASSLYHSLHPSGTPPLLPIPLSTPSTSRRARIPEADTPPHNRPLLATPRPGCEVEESSATPARRAGPTIAHRVDYSYVETRLQDTERRMMAALELVNLRVSYQVDVCTRESSEFCTRHHDAQKDRAALKAEIKVLRSERLAYEQKGIQTREALARSEDYCMALEARVAVLGTHARCLEWQRLAADDLVVQHIMRTQALEA